MTEHVTIADVNVDTVYISVGLNAGNRRVHLDGNCWSANELTPKDPNVLFDDRIICTVCLEETEAL